MMIDLKKINIEKDRPYWLAFNIFQGIGPQRFFSLLKFFGSAEKAWQAGKEKWAELNWGSRLRESFFLFRQKINPRRCYQELIEKGSIEDKIFYNFDQKKSLSWVSQQGRYSRWLEKKIIILTLLDEEYPPLLKELDSPPFVLYLLTAQEKGDLKRLLADPFLAVVGTRKITSYGQYATRYLAASLAASGLGIVSGLARGVDAIAHEAALSAQGRTVAVIGSGVDIIYPPENKDLYKKIYQEGAIISEFPPGMPPLPGNFPARNRIIAGLSRGTLVTEGALRSGSLITASLAAKAGREVLAVPGPINAPFSQGPLWLIKNGAAPVTCPDDVWEALGLSVSRISSKKREGFSSLSSEEKKILDLLSQEILAGDELALKAGLPINKLNSLLTELEIKGIIENLSNGRWGIREN